MNKLTILSGIQGSGKSTWALKNCDKNTVIVSRDILRDIMYHGEYIYSKRREDQITNIFNEQLESALEYYDVIVDNTHCKESHIDKLIQTHPDHNIVIKFFDISLSKAYYRNIMRYLKTGKWIPFNVIKIFKKNYDYINKEKYEKYV